MWRENPLQYTNLSPGFPIRGRLLVHSSRLQVNSAFKVDGPLNSFQWYNYPRAGLEPILGGIQAASPISTDIGSISLRGLSLEQGQLLEISPCSPEEFTDDRPSSIISNDSFIVMDSHVHLCIFQFTIAKKNSIKPLWSLTICLLYVKAKPENV